MSGTGSSTHCRWSTSGSRTRTGQLSDQCRSVPPKTDADRPAVRSRPARCLAVIGSLAHSPRPGSIAADPSCREFRLHRNDLFDAVRASQTVEHLRLKSDETLDEVLESVQLWEADGSRQASGRLPCCRAKSPACAL